MDTLKVDEARIFHGYYWKVGFLHSKKGSFSITVAELNKPWSTGTVELVRPIALYAGTRVGAHLFAQLQDRVKWAWETCNQQPAQEDGTRTQDPAVDGAALGFAQGWAEDLAHAREDWERKDPYWCAPHPTE